MIDLPVPAPADDAPRHPRLTGFIVASGVAVAVLVVEQIAFHTAVTALGLLVAPYLGWCLGPDAAAFRRPARTILEMAFVAVVFGAFIVAWQMGGMALVGDPGTSLAGELARFVGLATIGVVIFGLPALTLTIACSLIWYAVVHRLLTGRGMNDRMAARCAS
jgi:hypothetical protein